MSKLDSPYGSVASLQTQAHDQQHHSQRSLKKSPRHNGLYAVLLGGTVVSFSNSALNPAIPVFMSVFAVDMVRGSWILNAYVLAMSVGLMLIGYLTHRFDSRRLYVLAMGCFALGCVFGTLAHSMNMVIVARAIQGFAGGLIIPLSIGLLYQWFPKKRHGRIMALWGIVIMMSLAFGPLIGAYLISWLPWWTLFISTLPLSLLVMVMAWKNIPQHTPTTTPQNTPKKVSADFDWLGFITLLIWLVMVLWWIQALNQQATLGFWALSLVFLGTGLLWWAYETPNHSFIKASPTRPLLDLSLFDDAVFLHSSVISVSQTLVLMMCLLLLPMIVQNLMQQSAIWTGVVLMVSTLVASVTTHFTGKTVDAKGARQIGMIGIALSSLSTGLLAWALVQPTLLVIMVLMMIRGVGVGLAYLPTMTVGLSQLPTAKVTEGASLNNISRRLVSTIGIALFTVYIDIRQTFLAGVPTHHSIDPSLTHLSNVPSVQALQEIFVIMSLLLLVTLLSARKLPKPPDILNRTTT